MHTYIHHCVCYNSASYPLCIVCGDVFRIAVTHKVQGKRHVFKVKLVQQAHAQHTCVEIKGYAGILDTQHGLLHHKVLGGGVGVGAYTLGGWVLMGERGVEQDGVQSAFVQWNAQDSAL